MPKSDLPKGYTAPPPARKPGEVEAWGLTQAARRIKEAVEAGGGPEIMHAVRLNWRLWTIFQTELLDPQSKVPQDVRINILTLAEFVDKRTVEFIANPQRSELLNVLININRELAMGLFSAPAAVDPMPRTGEAPPANAPASVKLSV